MYMDKKRIKTGRNLIGAAAMMFLLWGGQPAYAADDVHLDLSKGDIEISSDGYRQNGGEEKDGPEDGSYVITSDGRETGNVVTVASGKRHSIIFDEVRITTSPDKGNPLYIAPKSKVSLTLKGTNILRSEGYAGIAVPKEATLMIGAQKGGSLDAWTGQASASAGIGGTLRDNQGNDTANADCGTIEINSGVIHASSIGKGSTGTAAGSGTLSSGDDGTAWIDTGSVSAGKSEFVSGVLFDGAEGKVYGSYALNKVGTLVPYGKTLTISTRGTLTVPGNYPLTLEGSLVNNGILKIGSENSLPGNGWLGGAGEFYILSGITTDMFSVPDGLLYGTGEDHTEYVKKYVQDSIQKSGAQAVVHGQVFTRAEGSDWKMEIKPSEVIEKGTYTVTFTDPEDSSNQAAKSFEVLDAGELTGLVLNTPPEKTQYTYGDRFSKKGMEASVTYSSGASKALTNDQVKVKDGKLKVGQESVTLYYKENGKEATCIVGIQVSPKEINLSQINWEERSKTSFVYDGTVQSFTFRADMPEGLKVSVGGVNSATNAGTYTAMVDFFLDESYTGNYVLAGNTSVAKEWTITPIQLEWNTGDLEIAGNTRDGNVYVYGELNVEGLLPEDARNEKITTSFPADKITGTHNGLAGDEQEITLAWVDENDRYSLGTDEAAGNYSLPEELPVLPAVIHDVKIMVAPPELKFGGGLAYRLDIESGISYVPDGLRTEPDYDFPSEIEKGLIEAVMKKGIRQTYVNAYDVSLMKKDKGESEWKRTKADIDPSEGMTVTIPYPKGITQNAYDAVVAYIYPGKIGDEKAGTIIYPEVTNTDKGIQFVVPEAAPVAVGFKEAEGPAGFNFWRDILGIGSDQDDKKDSKRK